MQVTINDVRHAVNTALSVAFPDIPVVSEDVQQDPDPPIFQVQLQELAQTQQLGRRFRRDYPFVVRYFPFEGNADDLYAIAEQLMATLQQIEIANRPAPGTGMRFEIVDGVLRFYVVYSMMMGWPRPDDPLMQTLTQDGGIKP